MPCCKILRHVSVEQSALQLFGWVLGGLALFIGSYALQNDLDWNDIIQGKTGLKLVEDKSIARLELNLTLPQQIVLIRNCKLEIVHLIGLSTFLLITIGVYTYLWIKDLKPNQLAYVTTLFHGLGSVLLACLSISALNGTTRISGHNKNICIGRYDKDLSLNNTMNNMLKFLKDSSCVCTYVKMSAAFDSVMYNLDTLKDLGICQCSFLKQLAGTALFTYTLITVLLACTQLKDLMIIKSATALDSSRSSTLVGYRASNSIKPVLCSCGSKSNTNNNNNTTDDVISNMDPRLNRSNSNNNNADKGQQNTDLGEGEQHAADVRYVKYPIKEGQHSSSSEEVVIIHKSRGENEKNMKYTNMKDNKVVTKNEIILLDMNMDGPVPERKLSVATNSSTDAQNSYW